MNVEYTPKAATAAPLQLAQRSANLRSNAIRDMLKVAHQPGMIALGGGNPAKESFPVALMPRLMKDVMRRFSSNALQYCDTQGFPPLRQALADWLAQLQIAATPDNIVVTTGSQNALDLLGKLLIDEQSPVVVEQPTYLGALQAFSLFGPRWRYLDEDEEGPALQKLDALTAPARPGDRAPLVYVMPTFRNPSGKSWSAERTRQAAAVLRRHGNWVVEDDPYRLLTYDTSPSPPLKSSLPEQTIYIGSLSKVFAPGLRLGYCIVPDPLLPWLVKAKQGTDLNTGTLSQALAAEYIQSGRLNDNLPLLRAIYRDKRDALTDALARHLPGSFEFSIPKGGMFLWVKGPPGFDSDHFLSVAIAHGVFFVPGSAFFGDTLSEPMRQENARCMRLNFSGNDTDTLKRAAERLGKALKTCNL